MKFFAVVPALLAAAAAEAQLPIAAQFLGQAGLYRGYSGYGALPALPYASAYSAPANFAYGAEVTALNASPAPVEALATYGFGDNNGYGAPSAPVISSYTQALPAPVIAEAVPAPVIAKAAPIAASHSSQYQAQDEAGNIAYGYQNINSAKQETGNALGGVTGSYSYSDEAGVHTVNYVADHLGFRVTSDNLPVGPAQIAVAPVDTPAVVEAKAAFFKAYNAAKSGVVKRSAQRAQTYAAYPTYKGLPHLAHLGLPYNADTAVPAAVPAPAFLAPLTTIKLNPGHATFYRVD